MSYTFHVGLAPFTDASGVRRSTYQLLRPDGTAIASLDIKDGKISRSVFGGGYDYCRGTFINMAISHSVNHGGGRPS